MPIYAYRCEDCGFTQDVLQKLSDPVLTECPSCGKSAFKKQLTAAGISGGAASGSSFGGGMPPCMMGGGCMGGPCG
ncbi:MAG: zinc ribbon domain-containing protein [Oxalobacter sp.]|nr:MAG: zinc ribbon domain-containing protein [Oxalobacter sp.]